MTYLVRVFDQYTVVEHVPRRQNPCHPNVVSSTPEAQVANEVDVPTDANQIISDPNEVVDEVEDWTCAICLDVPELPERCSIVGCGHRYCGMQIH